MSGFWDRWGAEAEVEAEWKKLSQDMMDVGEVVSLEEAKGQSYRMEDKLVDAEEFDELWDEHGAHDRCMVEFTGMGMCY